MTMIIETTGMTDIMDKLQAEFGADKLRAAYCGE